ncbi:hypothetical protein RN001_002401 [Aquatica leii]|uniref:Uncharacterized protein n=1 Tax=Aquatica leii TaxID=1421715 RepID=A0AAN7QB32_9COLE|nr:hypothetical protein RN001_002401 [Aquatica leii]
MSQNKITNFLKRKNADDSNEENCSRKDAPPNKIKKLVVEQALVNTPLNDVSLFIRQRLSDEQKFQLIEHPWIPDATYKFPIPKEKRNLKFQHSWLRSFVWLTYSLKEDGAYCRS